MLDGSAINRTPSCGRGSGSAGERWSTACRASQKYDNPENRNRAWRARSFGRACGRRSQCLVPVNELDGVWQPDVHAVLERPLGSLGEAVEAAAPPVERRGVVGVAEQGEDTLGARGLVRPHRLVQSGGIGAAQRVSPDPPAEPHVQLSLHAALRCNKTTHDPAIGQLASMDVGVTQIAQDFRLTRPCGLHHRG